MKAHIFQIICFRLTESDTYMLTAIRQFIITRSDSSIDKVSVIGSQWLDCSFPQEQTYISSHIVYNILGPLSQTHRLTTIEQVIATSRDLRKLIYCKEYVSGSLSQTHCCSQQLDILLPQDQTYHLTKHQLQAHSDWTVNSHKNRLILALILYTIF